MSGTPWLCRLTDTYDFQDGLLLSEFLFHRLDNCIGIHGEVLTAWWPTVNDTLFTLPIDHVLTGVGYDTKYMEGAWETNAFHIRPVHDTLPYETYTYAEPCLSITDAESSLNYGPDDLINNGYYGSLEDFSTTQSSQSAPQQILPTTNTNDIVQPIGNFYFFHKSQYGVSNVFLNDRQAWLELGTRTNKQTWNSQNKADIALSSYNLQSQHVMYDIGVRSWFHSLPYLDTFMTLAFIINANRPISFTSRMGFGSNLREFPQTYASDNLYILYYDPAIFPYEKNQSLSIDWITNLYPNTFQPFSDLKVTLGGCMAYEGYIPKNLVTSAYLNEVFAQSLAQSYHDRNTVYVNGKSGSILYSKPLIYNDYEFDLTSNKNVTVTYKDRNGFSYTSNANDGEEWYISYRARVSGDKSGTV